MMKRMITGIALVLAGGTAMFYLASCARQAGPLSPDLSKVGAANPNDTNYPVVSATTAPASLSQTAKIRFNKAMNPATINAGTIRVTTQSDDGMSENSYSNVVISYNALTREIYFTPANGAWDNNQNYQVWLSTGVQSQSGAQLDGNANHIPESSQFDNYFLNFSFGAPVSPGFINGHSRVGIFSVTWGGNTDSGTINFGDYVSVADATGTYTHVTLTVHFELQPSTPPSFGMDPGTFFSSASALHPNVLVTGLNGASYAVRQVEVTSTAQSNDTLRVVLDLQPNGRYQFALKGGPAGIRSLGTTLLNNGFFFDGNGNGMAEASDDTRPIILQTANNAGHVAPVVQVSSTLYDSSRRRFAITVSVPTGVGTLDPAYVNSTYIRMFDTDTNQAIPAARIELDNSAAPNPYIYVYVPLRFYQSSSNVSRNVAVYVSKEVRSSDGFTLDQNADGVLLTNDDNYQSASAPVVSYGQ